MFFGVLRLSYSIVDINNSHFNSEDFSPYLARYFFLAGEVITYQGGLMSDE